VNIVWYKRDLRLADHAPLSAALALGEPVLLIYWSSTRCCVTPTIADATGILLLSRWLN